MVKCADCARDVSEDSVVYCEMCGVLICADCAATRYCANCGELWETEIDLEDTETEEET